MLNQDVRVASAAALLGLSVVVGTQASAGAFTVYTDRAAFEVAAIVDGGALTVETFNTVNALRSFQTADGPQTLGDLTFTETGPGSAGTGNGVPNSIDSVPFQLAGLFSGNDTPYVYLAANADADVPAAEFGAQMDFAEPVSAFGADFTEFISSTDSESFLITLLNTQTAASFALPEPLSSGTTFFGIVGELGETFTGITFDAAAPLPSRRAVVGMDDVTYVPIPEPAAALGLLGLAVCGRRRRA